ncbi:SRPBCC family protein [Saccharothrix deserti]|uniref:SRPBCC family protein n=1 Tax=Saccharothrix deserti TaxID=2593674 RepID=UPI00131AB5BF|nr:SRPBCC family protein [Saccharothrix deserti]
MWSFEHTADTDAAPAAVWARYTDLSTWAEWYPDVVSIKIDGPFASGTRGEIEQAVEHGHVPGAVPFKLVDVKENEGFTLEAYAPAQATGIVDQVALRTVLEITPKADGASITHRCELSGFAAEQVGEAVAGHLKASVIRGVETLAKLTSN